MQVRADFGPTTRPLISEKLFSGFLFFWQLNYNFPSNIQVKVKMIFSHQSPAAACWNKISFTVWIYWQLKDAYVGVVCVAINATAWKLKKIKNLFWQGKWHGETVTIIGSSLMFILKKLAHLALINFSFNPLLLFRKMSNLPLL